MGERGFTLIEMMITAVITVVMAFAAYSFYADMARFQAVHERQKEMDVRLQIAMDILVRDIQHAGYGITDPNGDSNPDVPCPGAFLAVSLIGFCPAVASVDNTSLFPGTDTLTLLRIGGSLGTLNQPAVGGANSIQLNLAPGLKEGNVIQLVSLGGLATYSFVGASVPVLIPPANPSPNPFTLNLPDGVTVDLGVTQMYPAGLPVEAFTTPPDPPPPAVAAPFSPAIATYAIGPNPGMLAEPALLFGSELIATGIEDLQVNVTPGAVTISLMARTPDPNPAWQAGLRPLLGNHAGAVAGQEDNFHRATLTRVVERKN